MAPKGISGLKLLQLNAWGGKLGQQIVNLIKAESPDFICLQEIMSFEGDLMGFFASLEEIQEYCGLDYAYFSPVFSFAFMHRTLGFGNAIASKKPFIEEKTFFTHSEHQENFDFSMNSYNVRNFQHVTVKSGSKTLNILDHHGFHVPSHKNGNDETLHQTKIIADYVGKLKGPVILTGDFNLAPNSQSIKQINEKLDNLSVLYKLKTTRNKFTHKTEVCDYIFVSSDVKVKNFKVSDELVSDHKALILEFDLT